MTSLMSRAQRTSATYTLGLTFTRDGARVEIGGDIDLLAADDLAKLMESLNWLDLTIHVDLAAVTFIDSTGLTPIVEAAQRRQQHRLPTVTVDQCSHVARRLLQVTRLGGNPHLDLAGWEAFWSQPK